MKICVCDIGGTNFRMALFEDGKIRNIVKRPTPNFYRYSVSEIRSMIVETIAESFRMYEEKEGEIRHLSVCFPGPTDSEGNVLGSSVIFGERISLYPLKDQLSSALEGVNVSVTNDITAAAYRYLNEYDDFCLVTVSSGIGNKVCINGKVIVDAAGKTGEIGHITVPLPGYDVACSCGCGNNHLGMIASGRGVEEFANILSRDSQYDGLYTGSILYRGNDGGTRLTAEEVADAADCADPFARAVVDFCTRPLAGIMCTLAIAMDIPRFIIVGGFALNCDYYREALLKNMTDTGIYNFSDAEINDMVLLGHRDDDHGLIGCGYKIMRDINP